MPMDLPVFFIAGGDDPVGNYGKGVHKAADEFIRVGMQDVSRRIYPLCRHEILNELNKEDIFEDILDWMEKKLNLVRFIGLTNWYLIVRNKKRKVDGYVYHAQCWRTQSGL